MKYSILFLITVLSMPSFAAESMLSGEVSYFKDAKIPAQTICAIPTDSSDYNQFCTPSEANNKFSIKLPPGKYYVHATLLKPIDTWSKPYKAYFNEFVVCGKDQSKCHSHKPIVVEVAEGEHRINIDPQDWLSPVEDSKNFSTIAVLTKVPECKFIGKFFIRLTDDGEKFGSFMEFYSANKQDVSYKSCNKGEYGKPLFQIKETHSFLLEVKGDNAFVRQPLTSEISTLKIFNIKDQKLALKIEYSEIRFLNDSTAEIKIQEKYVGGCSDQEKQDYKARSRRLATLRTHNLDLKTLKLTSTDKIACASPDREWDY
ncbi:hypothetical protein ACLVWU_08420 [Bdellovibrio sp. HCB290]|uniref:hypothetical protein n=1 Tax=Bdellovibrio sp. HCB290 TaxID=3394356 RepID=UPI0039B53403